MLYAFASDDRRCLLAIMALQRTDLRLSPAVKTATCTMDAIYRYSVEYYVKRYTEKEINFCT